MQHELEAADNELLLHKYCEIKLYYLRVNVTNSGTKSMANFNDPIIFREICSVSCVSMVCYFKQCVNSEYSIVITVYQKCMIQHIVTQEKHIEFHNIDFLVKLKSINNKALPCLVEFPEENGREIKIYNNSLKFRKVCYMQVQSDCTR